MFLLNLLLSNKIYLCCLSVCVHLRIWPYVYFYGFVSLDIYLTPVKTQLLQYNLTRDIMLFYHSNNLKHKPMVAISSQYSFGADKGVQISQAVFFDKGTQPKLPHKNCKITLLIWISDLHYNWLF